MAAPTNPLVISKSVAASREYINSTPGTRDRNTTPDSFRQHNAISITQGSPRLERSTDTDQQSASVLGSHLQQALFRTTDNERLKGENFDEIYRKKRQRERVSNHEGIKKVMVVNGQVKKNTFKVYHFEPY